MFWERKLGSYDKHCKNKDNREESEKDLRKKVERMEQWKKAHEEDNFFVKEMLKCINKYLNNEDYYHTNQQLII